MTVGFLALVAACDEAGRTPVEPTTEVTVSASESGAMVSRDALERLSGSIREQESRARLAHRLQALETALQSRDATRIRAALSQVDRALASVTETSDNAADLEAIRLGLNEVRSSVLPAKN